jgi:hypothetical protein
LRNLIGHEDSSAAQAEDAKFEDSRGSSSTQPRKRNRGNPRERKRHSWRTRIRGESKNRSISATEGPKLRGDMESGQAGEPEARLRGNSKLHSWRNRWVNETGQPAEFISWCRKNRFRGNLETDRRRYRRDAVRGNPETVNRHRRRMRLRLASRVHRR